MGQSEEVELAEEYATRGRCHCLEPENPHPLPGSPRNGSNGMRSRSPEETYEAVRPLVQPQVAGSEPTERNNARGDSLGVVIVGGALNTHAATWYAQNQVRPREANNSGWRNNRRAETCPGQFRPALVRSCAKQFSRLCPAEPSFRPERINPDGSWAGRRNASWYTL